MNDDVGRRETTGYVGWALRSLFGIGIVSVVVSVASLYYKDFVGAGVCLIAAGLSFGLMLNGLLRN